MKIDPEHYELYEACILSGQIEPSELEALRRENPELAAWYDERARARRAPT
jgi:hypothetical protein